ncbi:MAG: ice-binding family protein [Sphaerochaeta sp.]|nr:ice-binding family protein [Sphaerochaeta sp.]
MASNILWQVAGSVVLGSTSHFEDIVLCKTLIVVETGVSVNGRLLSQSAVTLDSATILEPSL